MLTEEQIQQYRDRELSQGVTTRQLQHKALEILKYFQKVCKENNLTYWCGGGTAIGALRHQGFIPWDDDIDVFMPRPDYEKLYKIWPQVGDLNQYALLRTTEEMNIHQVDMQLVDLTTTFISRHSVNEDIAHGVSIDIMPFEGCPRSKIKRGLQIYHSIMYSVFNVQRLPDNQGKLLRFATSVLFKLVRNPKRRNKIWVKAEKKMAQYDFYSSEVVKETITSFRALFFAYPQNFFEVKEVDFEDIKVNIPSHADEYLTRIFGDYMSLPDESKRCAKHDIVYMNLNEPYTKYKGVYYLTEANGEKHD